MQGVFDINYELKYELRIDTLISVHNNKHVLSKLSGKTKNSWIEAEEIVDFQPTSCFKL